MRRSWGFHSPGLPKLEHLHDHMQPRDYVLPHEQHLHRVQEHELDQAGAVLHQHEREHVPARGLIHEGERCHERGHDRARERDDVPEPDQGHARADSREQDPVVRLRSVHDGANEGGRDDDHHHVHGHRFGQELAYARLRRRDADMR